MADRHPVERRRAAAARSAAVRGRAGRRHHRHRRAARPQARAPAASRAPGHRHRSAPVRRQAQGHRPPPDRHPAQEDARHLPRHAGRRGRPPRRHARPARERRRSTTRGTSPASRSCSSTSPQYDVPKLVRALERQRLRPAPGQPAVPDRGRAAARRRLVQRDPRPRRGRHARAVLLLEAARDRDGDPAAGAHPRQRAQRAVELPAASDRPDAARLRSDGAGDPRGRRGARDRARAPPRACAASSTSPVPRPLRSRGS